MIHSLAGGNIGKEKYYNFAKVEIMESESTGEKYWYISKLGINVNDEVVVPLKGRIVKGKVLRIDKNVSSYSSPIPTKLAKEIIKKV